MQNRLQAEPFGNLSVNGRVGVAVASATVGLPSRGFTRGHSRELLHQDDDPVDSERMRVPFRWPVG